MDSRLVDTTGDGVPDSLERLSTRRPESFKIGARESSRAEGNGAQVALERGVQDSTEAMPAATAAESTVSAPVAQMEVRIDGNSGRRYSTDV